MKANVTYEFTEEDKELLKHDIGLNPCINCSDKIGCCGCPEKRRYDEKTKKYHENNIYSIAYKKQQMKNYIKEREKINKKIDKLKTELPDFVLSDLGLSDKNVNEDDRLIKYKSEQLFQLILDHFPDVELTEIPFVVEGIFTILFDTDLEISVIESLEDLVKMNKPIDFNKKDFFK